MRQLAAAYFLPSINPGLNYDSHTGTLQQSSGNILSVNRSAFYVGAGANAVAAGTVNIPGVYYNINVGAGFFAFLASRQTVRQREFESIAVRNQMFLRVTEAYSELLRAEGRRAAQTQARDEAKIVVQLTADFSKTGLGRAADANRAATQLARREADIQAAEAEILVASANLCRLLNLDPSIRLHPTDAVVVPQPLVPDPMPVAELIATGHVESARAGRPASRHPGGPHDPGWSQDPAVLANDARRLQRRCASAAAATWSDRSSADWAAVPTSTRSCTGRFKTWASATSP